MPTVLEDVMFGPLNLGWTAEEADKRSRRVLVYVGIGSDLLKRPFTRVLGKSAALLQRGC
jgi:energy-coupling factor transporter ATP-binding protein EcfA2